MCETLKPGSYYRDNDGRICQFIEMVCGGELVFEEISSGIIYRISSFFVHLYEEIFDFEVLAEMTNDEIA